MIRFFVSIIIALLFSGCAIGPKQALKANLGAWEKTVGPRYIKDQETKLERGDITELQFDVYKAEVEALRDMTAEALK